MNSHKKYIKNIYKQYGKNIKAFEEMTLTADVPKDIEVLYKKHGLDLTVRKPMVSIINSRWGFPSRDENKIASYEDIERIAVEVINDSNN